MDWVYQYGTGAWSTSSMRRELLAGSHVRACGALLRYKFSGGHDCSIPGNRVCAGEALTGRAGAAGDSNRPELTPLNHVSFGATTMKLVEVAEFYRECRAAALAGSKPKK